jgi:hypothetical protein
MIPFLECKSAVPLYIRVCSTLFWGPAIGIYKPPDVRPILQAYHGKDIPLEYAQKEAEAKAKHIAEWKAGRGISSGTFTLSQLFASTVRCYLTD